MYGNELIDPTTPLQDPYSDVSLFLSRKIKEIGSTALHSKEWSINLKEKLLETIAPEFGKKFPNYRLGTAALKKTWEKVSHLYQLFEEQSKALTPSGKLNLHYLIRENLKTVLALRKNSSLHPFLLAQQLALKVGESVATYEGVRPQLEQLTELIWTALYHLVPSLASTKRKLDVRDRLIAKWMVDVLIKQPGISYLELTQVLQKKLRLFKTLKGDPILGIHKLCMDWALTLLPHTTLFQTQSTDAIRDLKAWIKKLTYDSSKEIEEQIQDIKTAALSCKYNVSLYDLEILSWSTLSEDPLEHQPLFYDELLEEAKSHLIHHPQEHWKTAITQAAHFIMKAQEVCSLGNKAEWDHRIELWSSQGELILCSLELPETPLLHLVRAMQHKNRSLVDPSMTTQLREQYLYRYQSPLIKPSHVHQVADLIRKYGWYRSTSASQHSTIDRWIELHNNSFDLEKKAQNQFPFLPFPQVRK